MPNIFLMDRISRDIASCECVRDEATQAGRNLAVRHRLSGRLECVAQNRIHRMRFHSWLTQVAVDQFETD